ncbi:MAG TPA: SLC13 family permease, partial [Afifellaceae bacterium]|nr:SLC13 family permease [Afifellaceae bacterium]
MAGYRLGDTDRWTFAPALLAILSLGLIAYALANYDMNVKQINSAADAIGLTIGAVASVLLCIALIWSGLRAYRIDETLQGVMLETAKTTSLVFIILLGAAMLTAAFRAFGGEELVREFLLSLPGGFWSQFIIVMAVIFILGFFLDFIEIAVVVVPIVAPILLADPSANITAVWLGVMIGLNIQTSFLTPPFGFALFYLRGVAPAAVKTLSMYKGVIAFICLQLLALVVVAYNPKLVNYLPLRISLTADTAPPPVNPRLQLCMEEIVFARYAARGSEIEAAIGRARQLDISGLPEKMREELGKSFDLANKTFTLVEDIGTAEAAIDARTSAFRPLHRQVRRVQADMARIDESVTELHTDISRLTGKDANIQQRKQALTDRVASLEAERKALEPSIPAAWIDEQKQYSQLLKAEQKARALYRRNADTAYEPVQEAIAIIAGAGAFAALKDELDGLGK